MRQKGFEPLSGMDAGFLYMETPTIHMHTLKVAIIRAEGDAPPLSFEAFEKALAHRFEYLPSFRKRIMMVPFGITHPIWISDPDFDPSHHLTHRVAPAPGGDAELNAIVSEVASRSLRRDRPLWEITMVDGLEGGRVAFVCKLHHAMADGAAALAMLLEVFAGPGRRDDANGSSTAGPATSEVVPVAPPSERAVRRWAFGQLLWRVVYLPVLLLATLRGAFRMLKRLAGGEQRSLPAHFSGPRTRFSQALTARRSFATAKMPLDEMKRVKNALGVTLNDVFLAVCGGAMRAHLAEVEGGVPAESLNASVPVNTDSKGTQRTRGNRVGHLSVSLCTHIADPVERVRVIHEMSDEAKQRQLTMGPDLLERWVEYTPPEPYTALIRFWSGHRMADYVPPPVNMIVSNVPGPRETLAFGPYMLESLYSVGPILEGIGLNITGWSYGDDVCFVGLACPDQIEDIQALVDRLPHALDELIAASESAGAATASGDGVATRVTERANEEASP